MITSTVQAKVEVLLKHETKIVELKFLPLCKEDTLTQWNAESKEGMHRRSCMGGTAEGTECRMVE